MGQNPGPPVRVAGDISGLRRSLYGVGRSVPGRWVAATNAGS